MLERNFRSMNAWMDFLATSNPARLRTQQLGNNYGDRLAPKGDLTPRPLLATAYWAYDATLMAEICRAIGRPTDAAHYEQLAGEVREAFAQAYVGPSGRLESGTQTSYVLALHMGLLPDQLRAAGAAHLVEAIAEEHWHVATGFVGVGHLLSVLSSNGYSDVAYRLLEQRSFPSWQCTIDRGATTIRERWDGWTDERGSQSPQMNSFNRSFRSVRGEISTAWARDGSRFTLEIDVPTNVRASVRVPSAAPGEVVGADETGPASIVDYPGAIGQREAVFEVGPGSYSFQGQCIAI